MKKYLFFFLMLIAFRCSPQNISEKKTDRLNCLTIDNFNQLIDYILKNGKQVKLHERVFSDLKTETLEISLNNRFIELQDYNGNDHIIIIDRKHQIPPYFIWKEKGGLQMSALYNYLDTDKSLTERSEDFCRIILAMKRKK